MLDLETDCIEIPSEKADEDVQGISSGIIDPENQMTVDDEDKEDEIDPADPMYGLK